MGIQGLLPSVHQDLQSVLDLHQADKAFKHTQRLLDVAAYKPSEEDLADALARIQWRVKAQDKGFEISCAVRVPEVVGQDEEGNEIIRDREYTLETNPGLAERRNKSLLYRLSRSYYRQWPEEHYVVDELLRHPVYADPERFGEELLEYSDPLLVRRSAASSTKELRSLYIRVQQEGLSPEVGDYVRRLERFIKERQPVDVKHIRIVESEDPHRIVLVRSHDNIRSVDFEIWRELREAYLRHIRSGSDLENAARLHIFPAEVNAAQLEQRLPRDLNKPHRIFHPKVVMLLEYADRLRWFFRAYALGFIKRKEGAPGEKGYVFELPQGEGEPPYTITLVPVQLRDGWPSLFEVMQQFVLEGRDAIIENRYINWDLVRKTILVWEDRLAQEGKLEHLYREEMEKNLLQKLEAEGRRKMQEIRSSREEQAVDTFGWGWESGQEYLDLADVARLFFLDVVRGQGDTF